MLIPWRASRTDSRLPWMIPCMIVLGRILLPHSESLLCGGRSPMRGATHGTSGSPLSGRIDFGADGKRLANVKSRGGKLLVCHGWLDLVATPASSLDFYKGQAEAPGPENPPDFLRLFLFPGMKHCRVGDTNHRGPLISTGLWARSV